MSRYDQIIGVIWFALGIGMAIEGVNLGLGKASLPGIGFVPFVVGVSLGVCGVVLTVLVSIAKKDIDASKKEQNWKFIIFAIFSLLIYASLLEEVGFLITTFLFMFFLLKMTSSKKWLIPFISALFIATVSFLIFSFWLSVSLPKGFWGIG